MRPQQPIAWRRREVPQVTPPAARAQRPVALVDIRAVVKDELLRHELRCRIEGR